MSNVVPFRRTTQSAQRAGCDVVSVADDLMSILDAVNDLVSRASQMARPAIEVERTVQNLLDAVGALEHAIDCIGEGAGPTPA